MSGIKVWYHPESNNMMISWHVYASVDLDTDQEISYKILLQSFSYVGEACENKNGITCIFGPEYLDHFEFIGTL